MTKTKPDFTRLKNVIAEKLCELEPLFKPEVKLTFFARHPTDPKAHVLVSNDQLELITEGIRQLGIKVSVVPKTFNVQYPVFTHDECQTLVAQLEMERDGARAALEDRDNVHAEQVGQLKALSMRLRAENEKLRKELEAKDGPI